MFTKRIEIIKGFKEFKVTGMLISNPKNLGRWKSKGMTQITYKITLAYKLD